MEPESQDLDDSPRPPAQAGESPSAEGFFNLAAQAARAQFDPTTQWDQFVKALWYQVKAGFHLTDDDATAAQAAAERVRPERPTKGAVRMGDEE